MSNVLELSTNPSRFGGVQGIQMSKTNLVLSVIGHGLRDVRESQGRSRDALAKAVGLSAGRLRDIERGMARATAEELLFLARELRVPASEFLGEMEAEDARAFGREREGLERPAEDAEGAEFVPILSRIR